MLTRNWRIVFPMWLGLLTLLSLIAFGFVFQRITVLQEENHALCAVFRQFMNNETRLALDIKADKEVLNQIQSSITYCFDAVWVSAAVGDLPGYKISLKDTRPLTGWGGGYWPKESVVVHLFDPEGHVVIKINLTSDLRSGDRVSIRISQAHPQATPVYYYDPETGLTIRIRHLDGTFEDPGQG